MSNPVLRFGDKAPEVITVRALLGSQGYQSAGNGPQYDRALYNALVSFQGGHVDSEGKPLQPDGVIGPKTWWALENPSGPAQRAFHKLIPTAPQPVAGKRGEVVLEAIRWWQKPTRESPDGANWGGNVSLILKHAGGARPWCAHFISHVWNIVHGEYLWGMDWGLVLGIWREAEKRKCAFKRDSYRPKPGDFAVQLHRDSDGALTGTGHIWLVAAVAGDRITYNSIGGNEGNRVKLNTRHADAPEVYGWINPYGDAEEPLASHHIGLIAAKGEGGGLDLSSTR